MKLVQPFCSFLSRGVPGRCYFNGSISRGPWAVAHGRHFSLIVKEQVRIPTTHGSHFLSTLSALQRVEWRTLSGTKPTIGNPNHTRVTPKQINYLLFVDHTTSVAHAGWLFEALTRVSEQSTKPFNFLFWECYDITSLTKEFLN